jgi:lysophospholipase L1-like esterase
MSDDARNPADLERLERGYYETLLDAQRRLDGVAPAATDFGPLTLAVPDVREYVLKPSASVLHRGARWTTNSRGMRDREYPADKRPRTYRIALVGDSIAAGWGVEDGQGFEPTWERELDARSLARGGPHVEILNFAVPGHAPGQRREHLAREGMQFAPDLVVFQGTPADFGWDDRKLRSLLPRGIGWDAAAYRDILTFARISPGGTEDDYRRWLKPHRDAILLGVNRAIVDDARARGIDAVWLLLPRVGKPVARADRDRLTSLARAGGFAAVVDLCDAFDGIDPATLAIGPDDFHPNARGHAILARRIDAALRSYLDPRLLPRERPQPGGERP